MNKLEDLFILIGYVVTASIKGFTGIGLFTSCLSIMTLRLDLIGSNSACDHSGNRQQHRGDEQGRST